jgi:hypothetical protein
VLLHGNARPHIASSTFETFGQLSLEISEQPWPYTVGFSYVSFASDHERCTRGLPFDGRYFFSNEVTSMCNAEPRPRE